MDSGTRCALMANGVTSAADGNDWPPAIAPGSVSLLCGVSGSLLPAGGLFRGSVVQCVASHVNLEFIVWIVVTYDQTTNEAPGSLDQEPRANFLDRVDRLATAR